MAHLNSKTGPVILVSVGDYEDFPSGVPDGGSDDEFAKVLWESLPEGVQAKFEDKDQIDMFLRRVDINLKKCGLVLKNVSVGVDPINGEAVLALQATFDEKEDSFQTNKELAEMMWDADQDRITSELARLRRAAETGDTGELGLS